MSNSPRLWFISNSIEEPFPTWVEYNSPDPTDWTVTVLELLCSVPEKFNVTVFAVVAFHSTSENVNGEFVENIYNRFVCYPAHCWHGPADMFGDSIENARMTLVFFLYENLYTSA